MSLTPLVPELPNTRGLSSLARNARLSQGPAPQNSAYQYQQAVLAAQDGGVRSREEGAQEDARRRMGQGSVEAGVVAQSTAEEALSAARQPDLILLDNPKLGIYETGRELKSGSAHVSWDMASQDFLEERANLNRGEPRHVGRRRPFETYRYSSVRLKESLPFSVS